MTGPKHSPPVLRFRGGTLELLGLPATTVDAVGCDLRWDKRSGSFRGPAYIYAELVRFLVSQQIAFTDEARGYEELSLGWHLRREPRPYQTEAIRDWLRARGRGVITLPTGAGKTQVALMAIMDRKRSTLIVVPTLDLVRQWYDELRKAFNTEIGMVCGGSYDLRPITVTTYDSAHLHVERFGNQFGLVIFDEVHHLPSASYQLAAKLSLAPYRLGLTATPERVDGQEAIVDDLVGPIVYRKQIEEFAGEYLAAYDVESVGVELSEAERIEYDEARQTYLAFVRQQGIRLGGPTGWNDFVRRAARSIEGRKAFAAYRRQKSLAVAAAGKLLAVDDILHRHRLDRCLIFTLENTTAYTISRRFLLPIITHHTKVKERSQILERFAAGRYRTVVTSKVLNEGVDVPDANIAIVVSGTGSVREHVQRLGRILRPRDGKRAMLYEIITLQTSEQSTSDRRREHSAYRSVNC
ncbi:MAG TPA: DEAD/DEAH box helicase family protein [Polyangiaceae bacterium]